MPHTMFFPMLHVLYFYSSTFCSKCAVSNMAVFFVVPRFRVFLVCCLGIFWMILKWFELLLLLLVSLVFTFHICCISVVRSLYFRIFSASFLITFLSPEIAASLNVHVPFSSSWIMMSNLLLGMILSALVDCIISKPYLQDLFLLILVHAHTPVCCLVLPHFPCICCSVVKCTHNHVSLYVVLLPDDMCSPVLIKLLTWYTFANSFCL